jgi:hypothetical protein
MIEVVTFRAPVAQLDRASGFGPEGHLFESGRVRHLPIIGIQNTVNCLRSTVEGPLPLDISP